MYKVTSNLKLKVQGVIKVYLVGSVIDLPDKSAQMFIQQGKLEPVTEEPQKPARYYEPTGRDRELERYIGKPDMNPNRYLCAKCNKLGARYCLGEVNDRVWWAWWCLECRPYTEPERN